MMRARSSAVPLAWLYAALILYASLYPFTGWRQARFGTLDFLLQAWPRWWTGFDLVSNLLGYLPLGLLICLACVRLGLSRRRALAAALGLAALLSLVMEVLQNYLPQRVPSNLDLGLNVLGASLGAAIGLSLHGLGGVARWQSVRERWFTVGSEGGLALLLLWPVGLLFPAPVVMGMGQFVPRVKEVLADWLEDSAAQSWVQDWLGVESRWGVLLPGTELTTIALGLLAPCLLAFSFMRPGWRRFIVLAMVVALAFATTTLSTALNFGPQNALAWLTRVASWAFVVGITLAALCARLPTRGSATLGLVVLTALIALVAQAPADPYFAQSLQAWEQGRFIRFHGAAKWVGWLWPIATLVYLLVRVSARADR